MLAAGGENQPTPVDMLNIRSGEQLALRAAEVRRETIRSAHEGVILRWREQEAALAEIAAAGYPPDSVLAYYVLDDETGFPFEGNHFQRSLRLKLQPDFGIGYDNVDEGRYMYVHIPIADEAVLDENFDVTLVPLPAKVGVEVHEKDGTVQSYVLSEEGIAEFENEAITGRQITEADREDELFMRRLAKRVDTRLALTSELSENMTNWTAQIQRVSPLGSDQITDL